MPNTATKQVRKNFPLGATNAAVIGGGYLLLLGMVGVGGMFQLFEYA